MENEKKATLRDIVTEGTAGIALIGGALAYGHEWITVSAPIVGSGFISKHLGRFSKNHNIGFLEAIAKYTPEAVTGLTLSYFTLANSVLPQINYGAEDLKNIPLALVIGLASYSIYRRK